MGRRAFLETVSTVRMQSVKVAALWDAVPEAGGCPVHTEVLPATSGELLATLTSRGATYA